MKTQTTRPTRAIISLENLRNNFAVVRSYLKPNTKVMAMVKANAYGHGILEVSKTLIKQGVDYLGVAYLEEALFLRQQKITVPILVCGSLYKEQINDFIENDVDITSPSIEKSQQISAVAQKLGKTARVHLKIDTGMGRIGVQWHNAQKFIEESFALPNIEIVGIFSHFAKAENDLDFSLEQIKRFDEVINFMEKKKLTPKFVHMANSAGITNFPQSHYNMVRPGIMLYGYVGNEEAQKRLAPVMTLKTRVSFFKVLPEKSGVSYGHHYVTPSQGRIVTLPVGYGDGYTRALSNKAEVIIRGQRYPVAGTICMDQTMVDIGMTGTAYNDDDVLLFGRDGKDEVSLDDLAQKANTITYEILCGITARVPRIYIE